MIGALLDEIYFDPRVIPEFTWSSGYYANSFDRFHVSSSVAEYVFVNVKKQTITPFMFENEMIDSHEKLFDLIEKYLEEFEDGIIWYLDSIGNNLMYTEKFLYVLKETLVDSASYLSNRNVAKLFLEPVSIRSVFE